MKDSCSASGESFTFSHSRGAREKDSRRRVNFATCEPTRLSWLLLSARRRDRFILRVGSLSRRVSLHVPVAAYAKPLFPLGSLAIKRRKNRESEREMNLVARLPDADSK